MSEVEAASTTDDVVESEKQQFQPSTTTLAESNKPQDNNEIDNDFQEPDNAASTDDVVEFEKQQSQPSTTTAAEPNKTEDIDENANDFQEPVKAEDEDDNEDDQEDQDDEEGDADADEEEEEDEDEVKVTIEDTVPDYNLRAKQRQPQQAKPAAIDLDAGQAILDVDLNTLEDKPWRKPGADISDYFNYGFDEDTWKLYCEKQKKMKNIVGELSNNTVNVAVGGGPGVGGSMVANSASETYKIPVVPANDHSKYSHDRGVGGNQGAGGVMKIPTIVSNDLPRFNAWIPPIGGVPSERGVVSGTGPMLGPIDHPNDLVVNPMDTRLIESRHHLLEGRDRERHRDREKIRDREKDRTDKERDREKDRGDREREKESRSERDKDRDREKNRDREKTRDRDKNREREKTRDRESGSSRSHRDGSGKKRERERSRDRERERKRKRSR